MAEIKINHLISLKGSETGDITSLNLKSDTDLTNSEIGKELQDELRALVEKYEKIFNS